jgi:hypothetical protein
MSPLPITWLVTITELSAPGLPLAMPFLHLVISYARSLIALQERWDGLRQARAAIAAGDYAAAMRTGLVCRKLRTVGGAKNARVVEEYEINTPLIEALNSVERRAAIEIGQEQENVQVTGNIS